MDARAWSHACADAGAVQDGAGLARLALATPTLPPATATNHLLVGETAALLVDPSAPARRDQDRLASWCDAFASAGGRLRALLLTHHHRDHAGAADAIAARLGVARWAHPLTFDRIGGARPGDRAVGDGDEIARNADSTPWVALHTPGHAPGHLAVWHAASGVAVAGDLVAGLGTILIDPSDGDMAAYLASLQRLRDLGPRALVPAHGGRLDGAVAVLDHYVRHRRQRERAIWQALPASPAPAALPADLLPVAYADVLRRAWPLALRSMIAHLDHLRRQGRATPVGDRWVRAGDPPPA